MVKREKKVWLDKDQIKVLENSCNRLKDRCIIKLGSWSGLRANEIAKVKIEDLREYNVKGKLEHFLKIEGKRTKQKKDQGLKKEREAYLPERVYTDLRMLINENKGKAEDPLIPNKFGNHYTPDGIRERVYKVSELAYESCKDPDFQHTSSHDLRRFFAHYNLEELGKNPRVVMSVGGWENWESIEPYLSKPSRTTIVKELEDQG